MYKNRRVYHNKRYNSFYDTPSGRDYSRYSNDDIITAADIVDNHIFITFDEYDIDQFNNNEWKTNTEFAKWIVSVFVKILDETGINPQKSYTFVSSDEALKHFLYVNVDSIKSKIHAERTFNKYFKPHYK